MPKFLELKSFQAFWEDYEACTVPKEASEAQRTDMKRCFLAGAWAFICLQDMAVYQNVSEDVAEARVMALRDEIQTTITEMAKQILREAEEAQRKREGGQQA